MCFSATASFTASATLLTIGIVSVTKSTTVPQRVLASIPFLFGIQQFSEGVLWLSISYPALLFLKAASTYTFVIIGSLIWPVLIPFSIMHLEPDKKKKKILSAFFILGALVSIFLSYFMISYQVIADATCYHIQYHFLYPDNVEYVFLFYFISAVFPTIFTSINRLHYTGAIATVSLIFAGVIYEKYLFSVWCFFVSIISILILWVIIQLNKDILSVKLNSIERKKADAN